MRTLNFLPKPTIARVNGSAYGGGVGLIACCDIAIGVDGAKFSLSEAKLGLVPAVISPYVVAAIGLRQARRLFVSAEVFDADEARAHRPAAPARRAPENSTRRLSAICTSCASADRWPRPKPRRLALRVAGITREQRREHRRRKRRTDRPPARFRRRPGRPRAFLDKRAPRWVTER